MEKLIISIFGCFLLVSCMGKGLEKKGANKNASLNNIADNTSPNSEDALRGEKVPEVLGEYIEQGDEIKETPPQPENPSNEERDDSNEDDDEEENTETSEFSYLGNDIQNPSIVPIKNNRQM